MKKCIAICVAVMLLGAMFGSSNVLAQTTTDTTDIDTTTTATEIGTTTTTDTIVTTTTAAEQETTTTSVQTTDGTTADTPSGITSMETKLVIMEKDGKVAARLLTVSGVPVADVPVSLQIGSTKMPAVTTNAQGYAVFSYAFPQDNTYIYCSSVLTLVGNTSYKAASAAVGKKSGNTTTTSTVAVTTDNKTTTAVMTTVRTGKATTTTQKTQNTEKLTMYTATGTTGKEETHLTVDFSFDSGILDVFKVEQNDFAQTAKLLLTPECYAEMLADVNGGLAMSVKTSEMTVTDEQIAAAMTEDAVLSLADAANIERIVLDLSLQIRDAQDAVFYNVSNVAQGEYVIQLPIPHSMRGAQTIAVSVVTADGVSKPVYAHISKDGFFRFETTYPVGTVVVMGIKGSVLGALTGHAVGWAVTFLVIGLLCIGGAVFLYVRYVHRPRAKKSQAAADEAEQVDVAANPGMEMPFEQPEIFELDMEEPTPLQERKTPDIDIPL